MRQRSGGGELGSAWRLHTRKRLTLNCSPDGVIVKSGYVTLAWARVNAVCE
jgi:hypothetical protein